MRPSLDYNELIRIIERFERNQLEKILAIKELSDINLLRDFLTIDDTSLFTVQQLERLHNMSEYIDQQSALYQKFRTKYDAAKTMQNIIGGISDFLLKGDIDDKVVSNLVNDQLFTDVVMEALVGQFANNNNPSGIRFNSTDFDKRIQVGGKAELEQIIKRVFWAEAKNKDPNSKIHITVSPVGSGGRDEDISLSFIMTGPKGGKTKAVLREDVKSNLDTAYLRSGYLSKNLAEIITRHITKAVRMKDKLILHVDTDELFNVVAELLGQKYGAVYNNGEWRANSAVFFTSPDGSIKLGSEILKSREFDLELNDALTRYAIRHGFMGGNGYGN